MRTMRAWEGGREGEKLRGKRKDGLHLCSVERDRGVGGVGRGTRHAPSKSVFRLTQKEDAA